jgi:hypothetical protein
VARIVFSSCVVLFSTLDHDQKDASSREGASGLTKQQTDAIRRRVRRSLNESFLEPRERAIAGVADLVNATIWLRWKLCHDKPNISLVDGMFSCSFPETIRLIFRASETCTVYSRKGDEICNLKPTGDLPDTLCAILTIGDAPARTFSLKIAGDDDQGVLVSELMCVFKQHTSDDSTGMDVLCFIETDLTQTRF